MVSNKRHPRMGKAYAPAHQIAFFESADPAFKDLSGKHKCSLMIFINAASSRNPKYRHLQDSGAFIMPRDTLRECFAKNFAKINEAVGYFECVIQPDHRANIAAGWKLTRKAATLLALYLDGAGTARWGDGVLGYDGKQFRKPRKAIDTVTTTGAKCSYRGAEMKTAVELNGDALHALDAVTDAWLFGLECPVGFEYAWAEWQTIEKFKGREAADERVERAKEYASFLLHNGKATKVPGVVVWLTYAEAASGRLYGENAHGLQGAPREIRRTALRGCWSADISNCHWALLRQMAPDDDLPAVDAYLSSKTETRHAIAREAAVSVADVKTCIIALIYGASLVAKVPAWEPTGKDADGNVTGKSCIGAIVETVGLEAAERLCSSPAMRSLADDVRTARKIILAKYQDASRARVGRSCLINDMGKQFDGNVSDWQAEASQLAFILQGAEASMLRAVMDHEGGNLLVPVHDGYIFAHEPDVSELESVIKEATGYTVTLDSEQL